MYVVTLNIIQSISYLKVYSNVPWQSGGKFFYKTVGVVEHYFINFYDSNNIFTTDGDCHIVTPTFEEVHLVSPDPILSSST